MSIYADFRRSCAAICRRRRPAQEQGSAQVLVPYAVPVLPAGGYSITGTTSNAFYVAFTPEPKWVANNGALAQMYGVVISTDPTVPYTRDIEVIISVESSPDNSTWTQQAELFHIYPLTVVDQSLGLDFQVNHLVQVQETFWRFKISLTQTSTAAILNVTVHGINVIQP